MTWADDRSAKWRYCLPSIKFTRSSAKEIIGIEVLQCRRFSNLPGF
jgi:hypothetical protein